ncbi:hypothetical protein Sjap_000321 [Stephania japonica]|uniref:Uncharacterized protein n=1 Tax=Stephania japonica TaxID=461633 RepID=A0AAP0KHU6_9MAGN
MLAECPPETPVGVPIHLFPSLAEKQFCRRTPVSPLSSRLNREEWLHKVVKPFFPVPMNHQDRSEDRQDELKAAPNVEEKRICCKRRGFRVSFVNTFGGGGKEIQICSTVSRQIVVRRYNRSRDNGLLRETSRKSNGVGPTEVINGGGAAADFGGARSSSSSQSMQKISLCRLKLRSDIYLIRQIVQLTSHNGGDELDDELEGLWAAVHAVAADGLERIVTCTTCNFKWLVTLVL